MYRKIFSYVFAISFHRFSLSLPTIYLVLVKIPRLGTKAKSNPLSLMRQTCEIGCLSRIGTPSPHLASCHKQDNL